MPERELQRHGWLHTLSRLAGGRITGCLSAWVAGALRRDHQGLSPWLCCRLRHRCSRPVRCSRCGRFGPALPLEMRGRSLARTVNRDLPTVLQRGLHLAGSQSSCQGRQLPEREWWRCRALTRARQRLYHEGSGVAASWPLARPITPDG